VRKGESRRRWARGRLIEVPQWPQTADAAFFVRRRGVLHECRHGRRLAVGSEVGSPFAGSSRLELTRL
jgi:hypothetical protein